MNTETSAQNTAGIQEPTFDVCAEKSDEEIVALLFKRDQRAIGATENKYRRYLYTVAYNILKDRQDSEECLNDVYLALWNSIPPHHPKSVKAYLTTLTRRAATDLYRKHKRLRRVPDEMKSSLAELEFLLSSGETPEKTIENTLLSRLINEFLAKLDKDDRALFVCRYYLCMSVDSIAEARKVPKRIIIRRLEQLKRQLKKEIEKEGFQI